MLDDGIHHAGHAHVQAVDGAAIHLERDVGAGAGLADVLELAVGHQRCAAGRHQQGRVGGQLPVAEALARGAVQDHAIADLVVGAVAIAQARHRRGHQGLACDRAGIAHAPVVVARHAAAHRVDGGAERRRAGQRGRALLQLDARRFHHQVLAKQLGQAGAGALAHVGAADGERDAVVGADAQPAVHGAAGAGGLGRLAGQEEGEREGAAGTQQLAAAECEFGLGEIDHGAGSRLTDPQRPA